MFLCHSVSKGPSRDQSSSVRFLLRVDGCGELAGSRSMRTYPAGWSRCEVCMKAIWSATIIFGLTLGACGSKSAATNSEGTQLASTLAAPAGREVELPSGTILAVRLERALSTARNRTGDTFEAILDEPVAIHGVEVLPRGTKFTGHVTTAKASGRLEGRGVLGITLDAFDINQQHYPVATSLDSRTTEAHKKRNIEVIGGGTGLGALIGGVAGGGKGAAIGAAVGAAGGTGAAAATGKKEVEVPAETLFKFSLKSSVRI
jgi:hypothetical protein